MPVAMRNLFTMLEVMNAFKTLGGAKSYKKAASLWRAKSTKVDATDEEQAAELEEKAKMSVHGIVYDEEGKRFAINPVVEGRIVNLNPAEM